MCFYSGYFEAALRDGTFKEGRIGELGLPDEEVDTFAKFVGWLYNGATLAPIGDSGALCKLWTFADRRRIPLLANHVINMLRDDVVEHWRLPVEQLRFIYENTLPNAGLRRLVVMLISRTCSGPSIMGDENRRYWPADAVWDVLTAVWRLKQERKVNRIEKDELMTLDLCEYHVHPEGVRCKPKCLWD